MKIRASPLLFLLLLFLAGCGGGGGGSGGSGSSDPNDFPLPYDLYPSFFVKNICLEDLKKDPYYCKESRDILPGEPIPYHNVDMAFEQVSDSVPAYDPHPYFDRFGEILRRVFTSFDFAPFRVWNTKKDGYDLVGVSGPFPNIRATRDPTHKGQAWVRLLGGKCSQEETWILFYRYTPLNAKFYKGSLVTYIQQSMWELQGFPYPGVCAGSEVFALTRWEARWVTYTTWKRIPTVISEHYNHDSSDTATELEVFYATDLYGWRTRWERWVKKEGESPISDLRCNGPKRKGPWLLVDCRDFTNVPPSLPYVPGTSYNPQEWQVHVPAP